MKWILTVIVGHFPATPFKPQHGNYCGWHEKDDLRDLYVEWHEEQFILTGTKGEIEKHMPDINCAWSGGKVIRSFAHLMKTDDP